MSPQLIAGPLALTHAAHFMTTSWHATATQMRARVKPAIKHKVFLQQMPFMPQSSPFPG